jgi:UDP-N-acetylmuramoyl-tripeptide--D-alanyl-D-alanine ligase
MDWRILYNIYDDLASHDSAENPAYEGVFCALEPLSTTLDPVELAAVLLASLSPLLTISALWQIKEWRADRMLDHLRSEGMLRQTLGVIRIPVLLPWYLVAALSMASVEIVSQGAVLSMLGIGMLQWILHRQPRPVWTQKAMMIVGLSLLLTAMLGVTLRGNPLLLPLLTVLQPVVCAISWILLLPLDWFLKRRILRSAAALRQAHPTLTVIGITGSVGKTTTKELIACALQEQAAATPAYVNSEIGVARWLSAQLSRPGSRPSILIVEMGAYRSGEIRTLCEIARPSFGVVTYVGTQHIALFGSQERLIAAKGELLEALPEQGRAFVNADSSFALGMRSRARCPVTLVSTGGSSDLEGFDIEETPRGLSMRIGTTKFSVPLHGTQNATNVLLAVAVAEALGVQRNVVANRLARFRPLSGTFSVEERRGVTILNDTHNCSPESASAAIRWAEHQPAAQKVLLTPGIIEQGRETLRVHRDLGVQSSTVFGRVLFTNKKFAQIFSQGYGKNVDVLSKNSAPVEPGALLVCLGRVSPSIIDRLLPAP